MYISIWIIFEYKFNPYPNLEKYPIVVESILVDMVIEI